MTPTGGLAPPGPEHALVLRRISSARPSPRTGLSSCLVLAVLAGGPGPPTGVDLGPPDPGPQRLGMDPRLIGDPLDRPLGPVRIPTGLHGHPRGPPTQPGGTLPRAHP